MQPSFPCKHLILHYERGFFIVGKNRLNFPRHFKLKNTGKNCQKEKGFFIFSAGIEGAMGGVIPLSHPQLPPNAPLVRTNGFQKFTQNFPFFIRGWPQTPK